MVCDGGVKDIVFERLLWKVEQLDDGVWWRLVAGVRRKAAVVVVG